MRALLAKKPTPRSIRQLGRRLDREARHEQALGYGTALGCCDEGGTRNSPEFSAFKEL